MAGLSNAIGLRTLLLAVAAGCLVLPASGQTFDEELVLEGHFFDSETADTLSVGRTMRHLEIRRGEKIVWTESFLGLLSDVLGTCRDLASGRDRVIYATSSGGSDGAMGLHLLAGTPDGGLERVFSDRTASPELSRYFRLPAPQADSERLEPVAGMVCDADGYMSRRRRGLEILAALEPSPERKRLEVDENDRIVPQTIASRELAPALVETLFRLHDDLGEGFVRATLAETEHWRFEKVAFYHFYASWGVVLLENKHTGRWRSIRALPRGDSKSYLIETAIRALGSDSAEIDFCTVCPVRSEGPDAVLELESLRLIPAR